MKPKGFGSPKSMTAPGSRTRNKVTQGQNLKPVTGPPTTGDIHTSIQTYGPTVLGMHERTPYVGGPGEPPEGFIGGTTSLPEWYLYWALTEILGPEGEDWLYQESMMGGRHLLGGAVVDYVIYLDSLTIGIRLQTYRFHLAVSSIKQSTDFDQFMALSAEELIIIDVFEDDLIYNENGQMDVTGRQAKKIVIDIINLNQTMNPLASGNVIGTG